MGMCYVYVQNSKNVESELLKKEYVTNLEIAIVVLLEETESLTNCRFLYACLILLCG